MPQENKSQSRNIGPQRSDRSHVQKGKTWFFGIAINAYQYFAPLNNAVKDVEDIKALLLEKYDLEAERVILLLDEAATRENIFEQLDRLVEEIPAEDKLIICYSGHGHLSTVNGFWIPVDAQQHKTAHYINNSTVRDYVKAIKARHVLLISDACFSGSLFVRGSGRSAEVALEDMEAIPSRWALCSGRHDQEVYDGEPGANSPFAESIIDALRDNQYKAFNIAKLAVRVVEQTRSNYHQLPEGSPLQGVGHKGGQFVFWLKNNEAEDWAACQSDGTLASYRGFLLKYPDGQFVAKAQEYIAFQEEEEAWSQAHTVNTLAAYYQYDRHYPQGRYTRQALEAIAELEEEQAWQKARGGHTFSSYRKYTLDYPQGRYRKDAENEMELIRQESQRLAREEAQRLEKEREEVDRQAAAWVAMEKQGNLKDDLSTHPKGKHVAEARRRIQVLQEGRWKTGKAQLRRHARWVGPALLLVALAIWWIPRLLFYGRVTADGQTYRTVKLDGQVWLAENLNIYVQDSWCYGDKEENCKRYGRLYNWQAAQVACSQLGTGWRLPTREDWKGLQRKFEEPSVVYKRLIEGGSSRLNARLGGYRDTDGRYYDFGSIGSYWSSTANGAANAYLFYFRRVPRLFTDDAFGKSRAYSCRCIKG